MSVLRIEYVPIKNMGLGLLGADHLILTFEWGFRTPQTEWYSIEGTLPAKGEGNIGVDGASGVEKLADTQGATDYAAKNNITVEQALEILIGTPLQRGSRIIPVFDPHSAWLTMSAHAGEIADEFPYITQSIPGTVRAASNSSSIVTSVLWAAGINIHEHFPFGLRFTSGVHTLLGTKSSDEITVTPDFYILHGGRGRDILTGDVNGNKLFGGLGKDLLKPVPGPYALDVVHGGQLKLRYEEDGTDTVDYSDHPGSGSLYIQKNEDNFENVLPDYIISTSIGKQLLYSIERIQWSASSDRLVLDGNTAIIEDGRFFKLGGEEAGEGDVVDFSGLTTALVITPSGTGELTVWLETSVGTPQATWLESAEWLIGTAADDRVYLDHTVRGVEGGAGNDLIDASHVNDAAADSPQGYPVEISGGDGDDTLVGGASRSLLTGGAGADRFVLTRVTPREGAGAAGPIEVVIADADTEDRLFLLHGHFDGSGLASETGPLLPVLGGLGRFEDLGPDSLSFFDWRLESHLFYGSDESQGLITFVGAIEFTRSEDDLLIHVHQGDVVEQVIEVGDDGSVIHRRTLQVDYGAETLIRVKNFQPGMLGIDFYDAGEGELVDLGDGRSALHYPGYDAIVRHLTNNGALTPGLAERPVGLPPPPEEDGSGAEHVQGTQGDDVISRASPDGSIVKAGDGDDTVTTGGGDDTLDGGTGADVLSGGGGDDVYFVDSADDVVIENAGGGNDVAYSSVSLTIPDNVETLVLTDDAYAATGSGAADSIAGSDIDNLIQGGGGDDRLVGGLGDDRLIGGAGNDTYLYVTGDGYDVVRDDGLPGDTDTLKLVAGVLAGDVTVLKDARAPDDLILAISEAAGGGEIRLEGYALGAAATIERVVFEDGTVWTQADLAALALAAPSRNNVAPVAADDLSFIATTPELLIAPEVLLGNDVDRDGDALTLLSVQDAQSCTVTLEADGRVRFIVGPNDEGPAFFTYTVSDGHGSTATAQVQIAFDSTAIGKTLNGTSGNDSLAGYGGPDVIYGLAGNDGLAGAGGDDRLVGGDGNDALIGGAGIDTVYGDAGTDSLDGVTGEAVGASERDALKGGAGDDTYYVNSDRVYEEVGEGSDTVYAFESWKLTAGVEVETIIASASDIAYVWGNELSQTMRNEPGVAAMLRGLGGSDVIEGSDAAETLYGDHGSSSQVGAGNDLILGNGGDDRLYGEAGDDELHGGAGFDRLYGGIGNDRLLGGEATDYLYGDAGADTLESGAGRDLLVGGTGNDRLVGGLDGDRFFFEAGFGADEIVDYESADSIDFRGLGLVYQDLVFETVAGGVMISAAPLGAGNTILVRGATGPLAAAEFLL